MRTINWSFLVAVFFLLQGCFLQDNKDDASQRDVAQEDGHPAWIMQGNIYEVNTRQITPEGTFKAFSAHLDRLKEMGVQTLWFMPIHPISMKDRKRDTTELGSYYAVADYTAINPEYGNMDDWKALVKQAHSKGFKVIIDWVPTHSGADHAWLDKHPDFYVKDPKTGQPISQYDWSDTRKLNYNNPQMVDSMIAAMQFWIRETDIDGFRCDVAGEVPDSFWAKCIPELKKMKNIFMLAEGDRPSLHSAGFDASYAWEDFAKMKEIAKGKAPAHAMDSIILKHDTAFVPNAIRMYFTSNHDENSWNGADFLTMPGAVHAPFAVMTQTIKRTLPLIYCGQEEPFLDSLKFFVKDTITFGKYERAPFYKKLLELRKSNAALSANGSFTKVITDQDAAIYAFVRQKGDKKVLVLLNLSDKQQQFTTTNTLVTGKATELFSGAKDALEAGQQWSLPAWGYKVYTY